LNLKFDRSKFYPKSIDQNKSRSIEISQKLLLQSAPERPIRSQKAVLPLIFAAEHAGFAAVAGEIGSKIGFCLIDFIFLLVR
jgi:hypothetical protein